LARDLIHETVAADTYRVSAHPVLLFAVLCDALALCVHDEARGVGGLLHLRFVGGGDRPSDATDVELSSVLVLLDRFKSELLGPGAPGDSVQARILAHASLSADVDDESASLVDLLKADLVDAKIICGTQTLRRAEPVYVCFQPCEGRVRICAPNEVPGETMRRRQGA
jgi:chemotaxis receptor (MCP) glutamine deamidase CheD